MDLTGGTRATATAAVTLLLGGLALTLHGVWRDQATHSLAGLVTCMIALTVIILTVIHKWVTDTSTVRTILAATQREAQAKHDRYLTALAMLENEQARLYRDLASERAANNALLKTERAAMEEEFELARAKVAGEAMEILASWIVDGKVQPPEHPVGNLIRFPDQTPQPLPHPEHRRERPRNHGVVRP
ncbi:hypothetical protein ACWDG1_09510 [Streptomyces sp. NPDC001177]